MLATARPSTFAPFSVRAFRFQWPADLATSWAFEMETLILGWYVLVETQSVLLLTFKAGAVRRASGTSAPTGTATRATPWGDLKQGFAYVWTTPHLLAAI